MKDIAKNNFIGEFMIDTDLCDKMIELHNSISLATKEQLSQETPMLMSKKEIFGVGDGDPKGKTSTDLAIHPVVFTDPKSCPPKNRPHVRVALSYWMELQMCMNKYKELLTNSNTERWIGSLNKIHINDHMIIQHYKPGQGFAEWHAERACLTMNRALVYMTYLNDVPDGGTLFEFQDLTVKAEKGKTLIWPAEFTHIHKSQISKDFEKYIVTGWFSYDRKEQVMGCF